MRALEEISINAQNVVTHMQTDALIGFLRTTYLVQSIENQLTMHVDFSYRSNLLYLNEPKLTKVLVDVFFVVCLKLFLLLIRSGRYIYRI